MKQKLFMLVGDIDINKGGINRVMFNRSSLLSDYYDVTLLTLDFNINYSDIHKKLLEMGRINKKVKLLNIHDFYRKKYDSGKLTYSQVKYYKKQVVLKEKDIKFIRSERKTMQNTSKMEGM